MLLGRESISEFLDDVMFSEIVDGGVGIKFGDVFKLKKAIASVDQSVIIAEQLDILSCVEGKKVVEYGEDLRLRIRFMNAFLDLREMFSIFYKEEGYRIESYQIGMVCIYFMGEINRSMEELDSKMQETSLIIQKIDNKLIDTDNNDELNRRELELKKERFLGFFAQLMNRYNINQNRLEEYSSWIKAFSDLGVGSFEVKIKESKVGVSQRIFEFVRVCELLKKGLGDHCNRLKLDNVSTIASRIAEDCKGAKKSLKDIQKRLPDKMTSRVLTIYGMVRSDVLSTGTLTLQDIIKIRNNLGLGNDNSLEIEIKYIDMIYDFAIEYRRAITAQAIKQSDNSISDNLTSNTIIPESVLEIVGKYSDHFLDNIKSNGFFILGLVDCVLKFDEAIKLLVVQDAKLVDLLDERKRLIKKRDIIIKKNSYFSQGCNKLSMVRDFDNGIYQCQMDIDKYQRLYDKSLERLEIMRGEIIVVLSGIYQFLNEFNKSLNSLSQKGSLYKVANDLLIRGLYVEVLGILKGVDWLDDTQCGMAVQEVEADLSEGDGASFDEEATIGGIDRKCMEYGKKYRIGNYKIVYFDSLAIAIENIFFEKSDVFRQLFESEKKKFDDFKNMLREKHELIRSLGNKRRILEEALLRLKTEIGNNVDFVNRLIVHQVNKDKIEECNRVINSKLFELEKLSSGQMQLSVSDRELSETGNRVHSGDSNDNQSKICLLCEQLNKDIIEVEKIKCRFIDKLYDCEVKNSKIRELSEVVESKSLKLMKLLGKQIRLSVSEEGLSEMGDSVRDEDSNDNQRKISRLNKQLCEHMTELKTMKLEYCGIKGFDSNVKYAGAAAGNVWNNIYSYGILINESDMSFIECAKYVIIEYSFFLVNEFEKHAKILYSNFSEFKQFVEAMNSETIKNDINIKDKERYQDQVLAVANQQLQFLCHEVEVLGIEKVIVELGSLKKACIDENKKAFGGGGIVLEGVLCERFKVFSTQLSDCPDNYIYPVAHPALVFDM